MWSWGPLSGLIGSSEKGHTGEGDLWQDLGEMGVARQVFGGRVGARQESNWRKGSQHACGWGWVEVEARCLVRGDSQVTEGVWKWLGSGVWLQVSHHKKCRNGPKGLLHVLKIEV